MRRTTRAWPPAGTDTFSGSSSPGRRRTGQDCNGEWPSVLPCPHEEEDKKRRKKKKNVAVDKKIYFFQLISLNLGHIQYIVH